MFSLCNYVTTLSSSCCRQESPPPKETDPRTRTDADLLSRFYDANAQETFVEDIVCEDEEDEMGNHVESSDSSDVDEFMPQRAVAVLSLMIAK